MRTIEHSVVIAAPSPVVWAVLTDQTDLSWNPFITELAGEVAVGSRLRVRIQPPGGRGITMRPVVTELVEERRLAWLGRLGVPGIFDGAHSFVLEPLSDRTCRFTQSESFSGLLVPFVARILARTVEGFAAMNEALKTEAERVSAAEGLTARPGEQR